MAYKISVIIPTYNRPDSLKITIRSLKKISFTDYEIIVVDNAPSESVREVVELESNHADHGCEIRYVPEPNIGLHNARHAGAKAARADILLYIDDDVVVDKNLLQEIYQSYNSPEIACVGGKILPLYEVQPPDWINQIPSGAFTILDLGDSVQELQTPSIYGANFSVRKSLLFELGGFNPDAFGDPRLLWMRGDGETGFLRKALKSGYKVIYNPKAICWHIIPGERLTLKFIQKRASNEGKSASYAQYREKKFIKAHLLGRSIALAAYAMAHKLLSFNINIPKNNQFAYHLWRSAYAWSRAKYEFRLIYDKRLKDVVLKNNWIADYI